MKSSHHSFAEPRGLLGPMLLLALLFALVPLALAAAAYGAPAQQTSSILSGPKPGPCADAVASADYVGGADATGHPVTPADGADAPPPVQIPGETVLVETQGVQIPVEIRGLNKGLAAGDGCARLKSEAKASHPRS